MSVVESIFSNITTGEISVSERFAENSIHTLLYYEKNSSKNFNKFHF